MTDMHLNPLNTIPQGRSEHFHDDVEAELDALTDVCIREHVNFICLSGDIFNLKVPSRYSPVDLLHYKRLLERIPVKVYCIPGNYDMPQASHLKSKFVI